MKKLSYILILFTAFTAFGNVFASIVADGENDDRMLEEVRKRGAVTEEYAEIPDTTDTVVADRPYNIYVQTRAYKDRVVVRWMPDDYMPFRLLNKYGVCLLRLHDVKIGDSISVVEDTLAQCLRPLSLEEFQSRFGASDSLAAAAAQTIYGRSVGLDQTEAPAGSMKSIVEVWEQQQELFGFAAMIAERRPDLAEAMALSFTDRTAKPGVKYYYLLHPLFPDDAIKYYTHSAGFTTLGSYKQSGLELYITDSISSPNNVTLYWQSNTYSSFDIERRSEGGQWVKLNDRPYVFFQHDEVSSTASDDVYFQDAVPGYGKYEYRIYAYDLFGDRTEPSKPHVVEVKDVEPPTPPVIRRIEIVRSDSAVFAQLFLGTEDKSSGTGAGDLKGFVPFYRNEKVFGDQWIPLTAELFAPDDSVVTVNVTGLGSGWICIAAMDWAGNIAQSDGVPIDIADLKAPGKPTNLRYTTDLESGTVRLVWDAPMDNDIMHYEVLTANDPTHMFLPVTSVPYVTDTVFVDTLAMGVNQKYIYYKVRAVDYSTNAGELSDMIEVLRPSHVRPQQCHLDSAWQDKGGIHMRWIASDEAQVKRHMVYRREEGEKKWQLLRVADADSVKAAGCRIEVEDRPRPSAKRWEYAVESWSFSEVSSGLSLIYSCRYNGYRGMDCPATLEGSFSHAGGDTRLAWDIVGELPVDVKWYWCVYRKGPKDKRHRFLLSVDRGEQSFADHLLREGESAEYYITLMMPGIGESRPSNIIKVVYEKE